MWSTDIEAVAVDWNHLEYAYIHIHIHIFLEECILKEIDFSSMNSHSGVNIIMKLLSWISVQNSYNRVSFQLNSAAAA